MKEGGGSVDSRLKKAVWFCGVAESGVWPKVGASTYIIEVLVQAVTIPVQDRAADAPPPDSAAVKGDGTGVEISSDNRGARTSSNSRFGSA